MHAHKPQGTAEPVEIDFQKLFVAQEEDDEESASLADVLAEMAEEWPSETEFKAAEVAEIINDRSHSYNQRGFILGEFLFPGAPFGFTVSARSVANRLKKHRDGPVKRGDRMLVLRSRSKDNELLYHVE